MTASSGNWWEQDWKIPRRTYICMKVTDVVGMLGGLDQLLMPASMYVNVAMC